MTRLTHLLGLCLLLHCAEWHPDSTNMQALPKRQEYQLQAQQEMSVPFAVAEISLYFDCWHLEFHSHSYRL